MSNLWQRVHEAIFKRWYSLRGVPKRQIEVPPIWPVYQRVLEKERLEFFLSYEKDVYLREKNAKNMVFLVGPRGVGKSWLAKQVGKRSLIIDNNQYILGSFLSHLKQQLVNHLVSAKVLRVEDIVQIVREEYVPDYWTIQFNKFLKSRADYAQLAPKLQRISDKCPELNFEADGQLEFWQADAAELASDSRKFDFEASLQLLLEPRSEVKSAIELVLEILELIEHERIQNPFDITETTGARQQVDFLFKLLNFTAGFRKGLKPVKVDQFSLIILGFDKLTQYYKFNKETLDFLDHLILSTFNDTGIRNHFPVVLESSNGRFFGRELMEMLQTDLQNVLQIDTLNLSLEEICDQVSGIFRQEEIKLIYEKIGGSLADWHQLTRAAVQDEDFELTSWLRSLDQVQKNKFDRLINMLFLNIENSELLDNNQLDWEIQRLLKLFIKFRGVLFTGTYYGDAELMHRPVIKAMQDCEILIHPRHLSHLAFQSPIYLHFASELHTRWIKKLSWLERVKFYWSRIIPVSSFNLQENKRGKWHKLEAPEPRHRFDDELLKDRRPYHEHYY